MRKTTFAASAVVGAAIIVLAALGPSGCSGGDSTTTTPDSGGDDATTDGSGCTTGTSTCGGACVDTSKDLANCGMCGKACNAGEVCSVGVCSLSCGGGTSKCGATCTDTKSDAKNCGACGTTCATGQVCSLSACALDCGGGTSKCGTSCNDLKNDPTNCGMCGTKCAAGTVCSNGSCSLTCQPGLLQCGGDGGADAAAAYCANGQTDNANCGGCGNVCVAGSVCRGGSCSLTCQVGLTSCPAPVAVSDAGASDAATEGGSDAGTAMICTNLKNDDKNCGACGVGCGAGQSCSNGVCTNSCQPPQSLCSPDGGTPYCANFQTDDRNCNGCGIACPTNNTCIGGMCVATITMIPAVPISGALTTCNTNFSNTGRKVAIDADNTIYVVMICGGVVNFVKSVNGGLSYSAPVAIAGLTAINEVAIQAGPVPGLIYVAATTTTNTALFTRSADVGVTFAAVATIDTNIISSQGISIATYNDNVYVMTRNNSTGADVMRNAARGVGAFLTTAVATGFAYGDVGVDARNGNVWVMADTPTYHLRLSTDGAVTFAAEVNPPGQVFYSDWVIGAGNMFTIGSSPDTMFVVPIATPTTSTSVAGLSTTNGNQVRSIAVDATGIAYIASQTGAGISLQRILAGGTTVSSTRALGAGTNPATVTGPGNSVVVAYTNGTAVYATVQTY